MLLEMKQRREARGFLASLQSEPMDKEVDSEKAEVLLNAVLAECVCVHGGHHLSDWHPAQRVCVSLCFNYCFLISGMCLVSYFLWA